MRIDCHSLFENSRENVHVRTSKNYVRERNKTRIYSVILSFVFYSGEIVICSLESYLKNPLS